MQRMLASIRKLQAPNRFFTRWSSSSDLVVASACESWLVQAHVERIATQTLVVCSNVNHNGQHPGWMEACCCDVQIQFACTSLQKVSFPMPRLSISEPLHTNQMHSLPDIATAACCRVDSCWHTQYTVVTVSFCPLEAPIRSTSCPRGTSIQCAYFQAEGMHHVNGMDLL